MKMAELMVAVLALPLDQKETFQVVLSHSIKSENQTNALVQDEMEAATAVVEAMPELKAKRPGPPVKDNSVFSLVATNLQQHKEVRQESLVQLIAEKRGWDRYKAANNLVSNKPRFARQLGVMTKGRGKDAVWFIESSSN